MLACVLLAGQTRADQQAYVKSSNPGFQDSFGRAVAISGGYNGGGSEN